MSIKQDRRASTRRATVVASTVIAVLIAMGSAAPQAATAAPTQPTQVTAMGATGPIKMISASCGGGRCTVNLSKAETAALGKGRVPTPPPFVAGPLRVAYYAAAYGHVWFAGQYAARNWCSGFRLSAFPWEKQGYFGYAC